MFLASILSYSHIRSVFPDRVIHFGENLGDQVKGRLPKKLKSLIEVLYVLQVKEHVLRFNMIRISPPLRVPRLSYPFLGKFGRSCKGSFTERAKIIDEGSQCSALQSTACKLESVECSLTKLYISVNICEIK